MGPVKTPEPDRPLGHSEAQMRALLGADYSRFESYMNLKATAQDADGRVFFAVDVRGYLLHHGAS